VLARAHAHNDYERDEPLSDALAQGFSSVEADVWLVDGKLLVAHDLEQATPEDLEKREAVWSELVAADVDYINTDDLAGLSVFLLEHDPQASAPEVDWFGSLGELVPR
jgi:hypothetical protein